MSTAGPTLRFLSKEASVHCQIISIRRAIASLLFLALLGLPSLGRAQVCCPAGCVQNNSGCVSAGAIHSPCPRVQCPAPPGGNAQPPNGRGAPAVTYPRPSVKHSICISNVGEAPHGSYHQSCPTSRHVCTADEDVLTATCKSGAGLKESTLRDASRCANIENRNGILVCERWFRVVQ